MMTAESTLSKCPVFRIIVAVFFLLKNSVVNQLRNVHDVGFIALEAQEVVSKEDVVRIKDLIQLKLSIYLLN